MPRQKTLTDVQRLEVAELADAGLSAREIAAELGTTTAVVARAAAGMGVSFGAPSPRLTDDGKKARAAMAARLLKLADSELDRLARPCRAFAFVGGAEATYLEHVLPQPDAAARLAIIRGAGLLLDKHVRMLENGGEDQTEQAKSLIMGVYEGLKRLYPEDDEASARAEGSAR